MADQLFTAILVLLIILVIPLVIAIAYYSSDRPQCNWFRRKFKYRKYNRWYENCDTCNNCDGCVNNDGYVNDGYYDDGYYEVYNNNRYPNRRRRHRRNNSDDDDDGGRYVGNDIDKHGCNRSAGYKWCKSKQKCIRPWKEKCPKKKK